jgi:hypothetical protein
MASTQAIADTTITGPILHTADTTPAAIIEMIAAIASADFPATIGSTVAKTGATIAGGMTEPPDLLSAGSLAASSATSSRLADPKFLEPYSARQGEHWPAEQSSVTA